MSSFRRRAGGLVAATFLVYAALVATHAGEFWPFSIYPMFSQAGQPWSRVVVHTVEADSVSWRPVEAASQMPGAPFAMEPRGITPIDLADFVSKTEHWDAARRAGLRRMFYDQLSPSADAAKALRSLLVTRVNGRLEGRDSVSVAFVPYALLRPDTTLLNPRLP